MRGHPTQSRWPAAVSEQVVRLRIVLAVVGLVMGLIALPASLRLEFNRSIGAMFKPDDPTIVAYRELQESFGGNSVVMLVYQDADFMSAKGLRRNETLSQRVEQVSGVDGVLSPAVLNRAVEKVQPTSLLSSVPALFQENAVAAGFDDLFSGYTHSRDHSRAAVVAMLHPDHSPETIRQLRQIALELPHESNSSDDGVGMITSAAIVGEPVLVHDGFTLIERDGARLATLTVALLSIVVVVSLADLRFVLLTSIMIAWSVVVTKAMMVWMGIHLSLVSTILTAIVTVIAVAAALHLGVRFRIARSRGCSQQQSTVRALSLLILPIVLTCATDAAGFAALYGSRILPVRQFGLMIAIAAVAVCVSVLLFAPATMMLPGLRFGGALQRWQQSLSRRLRRRCLILSQWSIRHQKSCLVIAGSSVVIAVLGHWTCEDRNQFFEQLSPRQPRGASLRRGRIAFWRSRSLGRFTRRTDGVDIGVSGSSQETGRCTSRNRYRRRAIDKSTEPCRCRAGRNARCADAIHFSDSTIVCNATDACQYSSAPC